VGVKLENIKVIDSILLEDLNAKPTGKEDVNDDKGEPNSGQRTKDQVIVFISIARDSEQEEKSKQNHDY